MASRNLDVGSNHNTFLTSFSNRQKNNVTKHTTSEKKQQHASFKEIQSVMTEYTPVLKDNIQELLYMISLHLGSTRNSSTS
ncbi:uncharacterized protein OCT59_018262 [Rhizophagus irregularis]|uniref:uncharacterized protein n=1 Tax=Rhizophagus irregularis TaxID=588596 RepID=UPI00331BE071|nr:hypothetical protein OCT59_018262 [Rhizophagus irregularis]